MYNPQQDEIMLGITDISEGIKEMVLEIVGDHMGMPAPTLSIDNSIVEELGADSLDKMELIMTMEELFGIKIPDNQVAGIVYVKDIVSAIEKSAMSSTQFKRARESWKMVQSTVSQNYPT